MADETALPLTITMASLPVGYAGTPQEIGDAIAERLTITSQQVFVLISSGATEPTSNLGPWAKNGNQWYYWKNKMATVGVKFGADGKVSSLVK